MEKRLYSAFDSLQQIASIIAGEVVLYGKSEGWAGNISDLQGVQKRLKIFNIYYTDDMFGRWEYKEIKK